MKYANFFFERRQPIKILALIEILCHFDFIKLNARVHTHLLCQRFNAMIYEIVAIFDRQHFLPHSFDAHNLFHQTICYKSPMISNNGQWQNLLT